MSTTGAPARILLIDDDQRLAEMLAEYLGRAGMDVEHREDASGGVVAATSGAYDAVVLDVMLPDFDGFEACRRIRAKSGIPIVMLTARGDETDRIVGLELGADDYLPKPFNPRELLARIKAVLRRARSITPDLLLVLVDAKGRVLSRDQLMHSVRGHALEAFDRSVDVHVSRIRAAIEDDPKDPRRILTVRGVGYVFTGASAGHPET